MSAVDDTRLRPTLFIRGLNQLFRYTGYFVADYPVHIIVFFSILTAAFSVRVPFTEKQDDLKTGYTPTNARALDEINAFRDFYDGMEPVLLFILVQAKDGGSMVRLAELNETVAIIDDVGRNFSVKGQTYYDICSNFCNANEPVLQYRNGLVASQHRGEGPMSNLVNLSYPFTRFIGRNLDLTPSFFGVETFTDEEMSNGTHVSNIKAVKVIILQFRAQRPFEWGKRDINKWERSVGQYFRETNHYSFIRPTVVSMAYTQDEVVRTGLTLFPFISVGFAVMCIFSILTNFIGSKYMGQWSVHKVSFAVIACITPLMATTTAFGLAITVGLRFSTVLCVTPFLVLAIGVDDAFLMINAWNRVCAQRQRDGIKESMRERMSEVLMDVGPSITITSLTNTVAFGMGLMMPTPEIRLLCIVTGIAMLLDYFYTITMYAAVMCIGGRLEMRSDSCKKPPCVENTESKAAYFLDCYCNWLSSGFTTVVIFILLVLFWSASLKGAMSAKSSLTPEKLFLSDSPLIEMNAIRNKYVMPVYEFVTVFIRNPGDLRNASRVSRIAQMVDEFEALPACNGPQFTRFWIRDYQEYLSVGLESSSEVEDEDMMPFAGKDIKAFTDWPEYRHWGGFMKFNNDSDRISQFFLTVTYHGTKEYDWNKRLVKLKSWREVADRYSDIGAIVYEDEALFTDQIETMIPTTVQTSVATLICMTIVCIVFMSNLFTVLVAVSSITSICFGVFGFLTLWGIDVDPISMATLIMSIGLSVDFPAHITFHYYRTGLDPSFTCIKQRMLHSLVAIGFPLLQCSASTILFVMCLLLVPCYMSEVFVKAIFLVISFGIVHALVVVPALLCALSHMYQYIVEIKDSKSLSSRTTGITALGQSPVLRRICSSKGNKVAPILAEVKPR